MLWSSCSKYALQSKIKTTINRIVFLSTCAELCNSKITASPVLRNNKLTLLTTALWNSVQHIHQRSHSGGCLVLGFERARDAYACNNSILLLKISNRFKFNKNKGDQLNLQRRLLSRYSASTIMSSKYKEFCFDDYDIIGFDLDCTLLRYNINEMIPLVYKLLCKFLVEKKSYPKSLLEQKLDKSFMQKGLVLDAENGNILKLSGDASILRAAHGTKAMSKEEIIATYGEERKWYISSQFLKDPLSTWNGPMSEKMRTLLDYFDFSASLVFAQAVDLKDAQIGAVNPINSQKYTIWADIQDGLIEIYSRENFTNTRSEYFVALKAEPDRYIRKTSPNVIKWIEKLRSSGKSIFLLTGSNIDFANLTASHSLGSNWQELFDSVVCFAKKPGFFVLDRPYLEIDIESLSEVPDSQLDLSSNLKLNCAYSQGNWVQLRRALAGKCGKDVSNIRSLYLGDNLIQDIYTPVKHRDLDTVAVCEELLAETSSTVASPNDYEYAEILSSPFWGSYFSVENTPTIWAEIISNYSQMCVPLVDHVADKPITHKFFCENAAGYYPKAPATIAV